MKIGFSSSACPGWDLPTLLEQAGALGYPAIELRGLQGHLHLPTCPAFNDRPAVRAMFTSAGVQLAMLGTDCSFDASDRHTVEDHKHRLAETLKLAADLGCPQVSIRSGSVPRFHNRDSVLSRIVAALHDLAPQAADLNVTILVENDGNLATSRDLWYLVDAANHPAVRGRWNPCRAHAAGETHGLALPRLGRMISAVTLTDATFAADGSLQNMVPLGQGQVDLGRLLVLMQGMGSPADLIVDWPRADQPADAAAMLAAALAWIRGELAKIAKVPDLTAYKGDKNAPRYATPGAGATSNG